MLLQITHAIAMDGLEEKPEETSQRNKRKTTDFQTLSTGTEERAKKYRELPSSIPKNPEDIVAYLTKCLEISYKIQANIHLLKACALYRTYTPKSPMTAFECYRNVFEIRGGISMQYLLEKLNRTRTQHAILHFSKVKGSSIVAEHRKNLITLTN
jgi:hypothetical protein